MRVISASRRTDIPGLYTKWFMHRLKEGFCHWINPFGGKIYRVSLMPEDCLAIVFWTRNPEPILPYLKSLQSQGYRFYFHFTLNPYSGPIEPNSPSMEKSIYNFKKLSDLLSPELVHWRYDPILLSIKTPESYHLDNFKNIALNLKGYTNRCYFSFVDYYGKTIKRLKELDNLYSFEFFQPESDEKKYLAQKLKEIANEYGISLFTCGDRFLKGEGINKASCIDLDLIKSIRPDKDISLKLKPSRNGCGCYDSTDIGAYDTCIYGCAYCYATKSFTNARERVRKHDPCDSFLWRPLSAKDINLP